MLVKLDEARLNPLAKFLVLAPCSKKRCTVQERGISQAGTNDSQSQSCVGCAAQDCLSA